MVLFDIEVIYKDDKGVFYYVKYLFVDKDYIFNGKYYIEIVMICFEIMMGDIVVVVNLSDDCYKELVGKKVILLLVECEILIIVDVYVDFEFGIGMVKIMFVYDLNDFKVGNWYDLKWINIMNDDVLMNVNVGKYEGMDCFEVCKVMVKDFED